MSTPPDDFDAEDAFAAELAKVPLEEISTGLELNEYSAGSSDTDDGDDDFTEPTSLQLLRTALERRERAAEEFGREWFRFCVEVGIEEPSRAAASRSQGVSVGPSEAGHDVESGARSSSTSHDGEGCDGRRCDSAQGSQWNASSSPLAGVTSVPSVDTQLTVIPTCIPTNELPGEAAPGPMGTLLEKSPVTSPAVCGKGPHRNFDSSIFDSPGAHAKDLGAGGLAVLHGVLLSSEGRALRDLGNYHGMAFANAQTEFAASAVELSQLAAETEATLQKLDTARKQIAEREALQAATLTALRQETLNLTRQHMAAWRIGRAWRHYCQGPLRAARLAAAVRIQAAWRGFLARRIADRLREGSAVLRAVEKAVKDGHKEGLKMAVHRAQDLGLLDAVQARLAAFEATMTNAASKLRDAARSGSCTEYDAALAAAKAFPSLAQLVAESEALFEGRRAEAEAALWAAVADEPMQAFHRVLSWVAALGINPQRLTAALEAIRQRDEQLVSGLATASRAQGSSFCMSAFEDLAGRASRLGLKGEAAAARLVVERRRRSLAVVLRARRSVPLLNAAETLTLVVEARRMGMAAEAEELTQRLQSRQRLLQAVLGKAVMEESAARVAVMLKHAVTLQVPACSLQDFQALLSKRRAACSLAALDAATCDSFCSFLTARGAAVCSGVVLMELLAADRAMLSRQLSLISSLLQALQDICSRAPPPSRRPCADTLVVETEVRRSIPMLERVAGGQAVFPTKSLPWSCIWPTQAAGKQLNELSVCSLVLKLVCVGSHFIPEIDTGRSTSTDMHLLPGSLQHFKDPSVLLSAKTEAGSDEVCGATATALPLLPVAVELGLPDASFLAVCALNLHHAVLLANGSCALLESRVEVGCWGLSLLSPYGIAKSLQECRASLGGAGGAVYHQENEDELVKHIVSLVSRRMRFSVRLWTVPPNKLVFPSVSVSESPNKPMAQGRQVPAINRVNNTMVQRPAPSAGGQPNSVPKVAILCDAAGASCGCAAADLIRLDLGLERLTSLQGVDSLCPRLRSLSADANQVSSLHGLEGLTGLQELSLKHNHLTSLLRCTEEEHGEGALPSGTRLQRLVLDSNKLGGQLMGLSRCSGLRTLSLADNGLTGIGLELEACKAVLTSLSLRSNCLISLREQVQSLINLRELDVSANRLKSLDGLQGLMLLQTLRANGNEIAELPKPFCLPHLTALDLGQNSLTAFGDVETSAGRQLVLPSLQRLVLQENSISLLGTLGSMLHLTFLDLSFNKLASLDALNALAPLSGLRHLSINNNPMTIPVAACSPSSHRRFRGAPATDVLVGPQSVVSSSILRTNDVIAWALPSLQELDYVGVAWQTRLRHTLRAAMMSPANTLSGARQLRAAGASCVVRCNPTCSVAVALNRRQPYAVRPQARLPASDRVTTRPPMFCATVNGVPVNPVALRSMLVSAVLASGSSAVSGHYAEFASVFQATFSRSVHSVATAQLLTAKQCGLVALPQQEPATTAASWLTRVSRGWHAALSSESVQLNVRQLSLPARFGLRDDLASTASDNPRGPLCGGARQRADTLDFVPMRRLRPTFRSLQYFAKSAVESTTCRPTQSSTGADDDEFGGRSYRASTHAIGAEIRWRAAAASSQAGRQLLEELQRLHQQHVGGASAGVNAALSTEVPGALTARPSYFLSRMRSHADGAASLIQSTLRGLHAHKSPQSMSSESSQALQHRSATLIQAWWRGHCARKMHACSMLEVGKTHEQELIRQAAAAVIIQAHFRGYLVRKRLRTALAAVQLPSGFQMEFELGIGELDDMLHEILSPAGKLLQEEDESVSRGFTSAPQVQASAPWISPWQQGLHIQQQQLRPHGVSAPRHDGASGWLGPQSTVMAGFGHGPLQAPQGLPTESEEIQYPANGIGMQRRSALPSVAQLSPCRSADTAVERQPDFMSVEHGLGRDVGAVLMQPESSACPAVYTPSTLPGRLLPPISSRGGAPQTEYWPSSNGLPCHDSITGQVSPVPRSNGGVFPPGCSGTRTDHGLVAVTAAVDSRTELRHRRHLERLEKLMAEWGFKDLSTAEAYHRRAMRQKQGHTPRHTQQVTGHKSVVPGKAAAGMPEACLGAPASLKRNLNSADGVLLSGHESSTGGILPRLSRSSSQDGDGSFRPADNTSPANGGRHVLAPLATACVRKLPAKSAKSRPYHLPALTSNNWVASPTVQSLSGVARGKASLQLEVRGAGGATSALDESATATGRPGTVQSVSSTPEVIML